MKYLDYGASNKHILEKLNILAHLSTCLRCQHHARISKIQLPYVIFLAILHGIPVPCPPEPLRTIRTELARCKDQVTTLGPFFIKLGQAPNAEKSSAHRPSSMKSWERSLQTKTLKIDLSIWRPHAYKYHMRPIAMFGQSLTG